MFHNSKVKLSREYIKLSPLSSAVIPHRMPDGRVTKTGYVKLASFSQVIIPELEATLKMLLHS